MTVVANVLQQAGLIRYHRGQIEIVDRDSGGWGHIGLDDIEFSDTPRTPTVALEKEEDFGSLGLALLGSGRGTAASATWRASTTEEVSGRRLRVVYPV